MPGLDLGNVDARCALVDKEHGDATTAPFVLVGDGLEHPEVAGKGVADEELVAVDHPVVTVA